MPVPTVEWVEKIVFVSIVCGECGVPFALTDIFISERRKSGQDFYCPNGHARVYRETLLDRVQKRAEKAEREATRLRAENDQAWARVTEERKARTAAEKETKRIQKRATAGICQECHRQFQDVGSHMKTRHGASAERSAAGKAEKAKRVKA